ncbi:hypothetical protein [Microbacterium gilvum]|uniref:Translation initiation factor IF-2 n=1 Tax=Microbacterium gilvum TaxID=1336204 RepID=A0ABP9A4Y5_9MICO
MAEAAPARKVQFTVPPADVTVNEWLDFQYSPSESLRRLIREAVAREGFVDVANRPVRPPRNPVYVAQDFPPDNALTAPPVYDDEPEPEPELEPEPEPAPTATRRSSTRSSEAKPAASSSSKPAAAKPSASKPSSPKTPSAKPKAAAPSSDATSASATIDDILGL